MAIILVDDGTLDTVFECDTCGMDYRFNFANESEYFKAEDFPRWVSQLHADVDVTHNCTAEVN